MASRRIVQFSSTNKASLLLCSASMQYSSRLLPSTLRLYSSLCRSSSCASPFSASTSLSHVPPLASTLIPFDRSLSLNIHPGAHSQSHSALFAPVADPTAASLAEWFSPSRPYSATYEPALYSFAASTSTANLSAATTLPLSFPYALSSTPPSTPSQSKSPSSDDHSSNSLLRQHIFPYLPLGIVAGFVGSLTGVGGALVIAPLLQMFLSPTAGLTRASQISGTALMTCAAGSLTGSLTCLLHGAVDFGAALTMGVTAAALLPIGAKLNTILPEYWLQRILAVAFLFFAPLVLLKNYAMNEEHEEEKRKKRRRRHSKSKEKSTSDNGEIVSFDSAMSKAVKDIEKYFRKPDHNAAHHISPATFISLGAVVGLINGIVGFGGGLLTCTTLSLSQGALHDMSHPVVLGTSLTMLFFPSLMGSVLHFRKGNFVAAHHLLSKLSVHPRLAAYEKTLHYVPLLSVISGAAVGAVIGADVAVQWLPEEFGRYVLGIFLIATGLRQFTRLKSLRRH